MTELRHPTAPIQGMDTEPARACVCHLMFFLAALVELPVAMICPNLFVASVTNDWSCKWQCWPPRECDAMLPA